MIFRQLFDAVSCTYSYLVGDKKPPPTPNKPVNKPTAKPPSTRLPIQGKRHLNWPVGLTRQTGFSNSPGAIFPERTTRARSGF